MSNPGIPGIAMGRRRFVRIAALAGAALVAGGPRPRPTTWRWTGSAMGAEAHLTLQHDEPAAAEAAAAACLQEIDRLENEFSLFRPDSAICRLNREGKLTSPSADMLAILRYARWLGERTGGAFDISVQPLWRLYAGHFSASGGPLGPAHADVVAARRLVDFRRIEASSDVIRLDTGMEITLNGIAQGYVTDRVADILWRQGWRHVLVELGEIRALGPTRDGAPWTIGTPNGALGLAVGALATSAAAGALFEPGGTHHHLFNPTTGGSSRGYASVTVEAPRAVLADGLSTALAVMPPEAGRRLLRNFSGVTALATDRQGGVRRLA